MIHTGGKYSQSSEDRIIESCFGSRTGTLLELGSNDGRSLSNSLYAIERGWSAVLVEPSQTAFSKLSALHKDRPNVSCYQVAIGEENGVFEFFESGTHLGTGDTALISTLKKSETERWKGSQYDNFTQTKTEVMTWPDFYALIPEKRFELISIDCEGLDLYIMEQMDFIAMETEMIIVESNGKDFEKYNAIAEKNGMKLYAKTFENLIFVK